MAETRRFAGIASRAQLKAANNLGIILRPAHKSTFRKPDLELFDSYYERRQYDGLSPWNVNAQHDGTYVPIRDRKPSIIANFAKNLSSRLTSKLIGQGTFPLLKVEDDPDMEEFLRLIRQTSRLRAFLLEPTRRMINSGSVLVRFSIMGGQYKIQHFLSKWCFPEFDEGGNLIFVRVQYVFEDENDLDDKQRPKKKWFRLDLGQLADISYDNPEFTEDKNEPEFKVLETAAHELGFVQAEWFKTAEQPNSIDGPSMIEDVLGFIDEMNYSLSQSATAIQYNQDPQLTFSNIDEDEMAQIIRSSMKSWNLGREGEASFLEAGMAGVEAAGDFRDKLKVHLQDISRVIMLDPEKMVGHAQSGKAMEVLHGPMVELIEELRPMYEKHLQSLITKMALATLIQDRRGALVPIDIPPGFKPKSANITVVWPEIFPMTLDDLQKKVSIANSVSSANIISRETILKWIAKDFGIEDIEEEAAKVNAQPVINPFGGF